MKFTKGNKFAHSRRQRRGGRPNRAETEAKKIAAEVEKLAADLAQKYLENHLKPILDAYISLATGMKVGRVKRKLDPATTRHAVERFIGQAPRKLILDAQETVEAFFEELEKATAEKGED